MSTALPSSTREFLGIGDNAGRDNFAATDPSFGRREDAAPFPMPGNPQNVDLDSFDDKTRKERTSVFRAAAQELFRTDVSKLDDAGAWGLYHAVTESMFGLADEDGSVAFGKRAAKDPRQNIDMLRRFVKGEYTLIEDPEYTKWREMNDEEKFKYALENETKTNKIKSNLKGERGASFWEMAAMSGMSSAPGMQLPAEERSDIVRRSNYETLTDEEKEKYRADVVADYDKKLSRRQTLATFLQFSQGLSDRASWMLAKSFNDGVPDSNIETLLEDERDRVYSAFSLMRGDQKSGTLLFVPTDFTDNTKINRVQLGLYGLQQSVLGLFTDTWGMAKDAALAAYAKTALSESERKDFFDWWNAQARMEQAMKQDLPEAESFFGEAFQGVAENIHWFIPYGAIIKGGKMVTAARGLKESDVTLKGWKHIFQPLKDLKVTLTPMRLGGTLKEQKAALEAGKAAMEAGAAATKAAWTLDVNGVKKLGDMGSTILARQMAAVERYTQMLNGINKDLEAAKWWKDAAGTGMWAVGEAQAFSAFASEYIANADAAGISREESVLTAAAIGLINAKIEQLYVPGLDSSLSPAQIKSLTFAAMAQAVRSDGAAGFRKWLANRVAYGVREGVKVAATEGLVEEPLQQMAIEHGKAFDKLCQELRENGNATAANEAKALWDSIVATLPQDYATFIDTAADMLPSSIGFGVTTIGNMTRRQHIQNVMVRHANRRAGSTSTMGTAQSMEELMGATDYDAGVVDMIQRAWGVRNAVEKHWQGEGGEGQNNPHRFEEAITAARQAFRNSQGGDVVREVAQAAGVDVKTAEVLTQYLQVETEAAAFSPTVRAWTALNMSLADIDEQTIKTILPGYVEGSFAADPEAGVYSGKVKLADGSERTIAYKVGDISEELMKQAEVNSKINSAFGRSWDARIEENNSRGIVDGAIAADMTRKWAELSDQERYMAAVRAQASVNGFSSGTSGVFELTDAKGEKVRVNADDIIYLASGRIADIGYGAAATQGTVRHETFHSLWRFARASLDDADIQALAKTLGVDVTKDGWEVELDEKMAHQMEQYASGHYVSHAVSSRFDKMLDGWAGKLVNFFGKFGPKDEVTDPQTGEPYRLKGLYDKILRGELGSGVLGVELRKIPAEGNGTTATGGTAGTGGAAKSTMPVEVTDEERAAAEEEMRQGEDETKRPADETKRPAVVATVDNLNPWLKAASVELAENGSNPDDPGHRLKTASKEELIAAQNEIVKALNDPNPEAYDRFVSKMGLHGCRIQAIEAFKDEWKRLHPEVDLNNTPHALARERASLELDVENARENLSAHPNSKHWQAKLQEAKAKLAEFMAAHPDAMPIEKRGVTTAPVPVATAEKPADAATPNQRYYRVGLPNSNVKLVGRLEVRDVETGVITSTDADYHDRGNQNRDDKSEESRALVEKIGANPDPLQLGTVQPIASNGIIWILPNGDDIIGNHRANGVRRAYEKGTAGDLEKFVREDAAKRGIEIGENVKKPITVFVLERIETPEGTLDSASFDEQVHEVVRLANESQNRGFNVREQAANDAKILVDNNLLPRMVFRADGRIDEMKSGDVIGKFRQETGAQGMIAEDGSLTEEGQTRIQNAALAALLGRGENAALLQKIMANAGRLDMQNELRALMKMTPELMSLAEAKPAYDLRAPLAEALQLFTEWRDKDETARVEKGKTRHDWRETAKDGHRVRGISWEQFMSQGDMFRTPSDEAKILGDLFARAEAERSFDREDVESAVGKKRAIDLISNYLTDYIENARAVNTETEDIFGGAPASRAEVMAAQRVNPAGGVRFSVDPAKVRPATKEEYDAALSTWGDMKIDAGNVASAGWIFPDGRVLKPKMHRTAFGMAPHHDSLFAFLERPERSNEIEKFEYGYADSLAGGAVRLNLGNGGIEVMRLPTAEQLDTLYDALDAGYGLMEDEGEDVLRVDVDRENGSTVFTAQYRRGTSARRIMDDLREWFESAKVPDAAANARFSISGIYTGSAADYDKPSLHYVGSGEGSQVYGWGLYGSTVRDVAEGYAASAKRDKAITQDEETFQAVKKVLGKSVSEDILQAIYEGVTGNSDWGEVKAWIKRDAEWDDEIGPEMLSVFRKKESELKKVHEQYAAHEQIYEQTWFTNREPGDESHLLKWYRPVEGDQRKWIEDALQKENLVTPEAWGAPRADGAYYNYTGPTISFSSGDSLYRSLTKLLGSPRAASEFLARAGIDGVKYPVDSYGKTLKNGDEAGWNYVSFSDEHIRVDHKWTDGQQRFSIAMTQVGDWYYMTGNDAEKAAPYLGTKIVLRNGTSTTAFPAYLVDTMLARLIRNGLSATLRNRMPDGTYRERKVEPGVPTGNERFSFAIGEIGVTNLDDALFVSGGLTMAEQMLGDRDWAKIKKDERQKIKLATGWEKGADGIWRYETGDFPEIDLARLKKPNPEYKEGGAEENPSPDDKKPEPAKYLPVKLADMFAKKQWKHIPLFTAYPWLKNVTIQYGATNLGGANGAFDDSGGKYLISISEEKRPDTEGVRTTLIHEIQHAIQGIEGFAQGGNSKMMRKAFLKKFVDAQDEARKWNNRFYWIIHQYDTMTGIGYLNYPRKHPRHIEAAQQVESNPEWAQLEEDRKEFRKKWGHDPKFFLDSDWGAWAKAEKAGFRDYRKLAGEVEARNAARRTAADRGKLLEETEDEPRRSQIVRFSIAAKLDDERRRLEAKGGKLLLAFHGTQSGGFTVFDQAKNNAGMPGFYFAKDRDTAMTYSSSVRYNGDDEGDIDGVFEGHNALYNDKGVYNVALRMERPLEIDAQGKKWDSVPYEGENRMTREIVEDAFAKGYDGVIIHNVLDNGGGGMSGYLDPSDVYVVKESNQIKSVDDVTYADDDSIIPEESRLDWTNPDIRYSISKDLRDAMRRREIMQGIPVEGAVQPWPANFPKVMLQTTLANIKQKWPELFERAKAGGDGAALELVRNILGEARIKGKSNPKWEKLRKLAKAHPRALILPVRAQEMTGRNKIPSAYAAVIRALTGLRLAGNIVQTVRANHTGANAVDRMTRRAIFDGPVMRGREYILIDDHVTQGGTLNELRKFIQARGGKVVAITTLTASQFSDTISISNEAVRTLYAKFGNDLDEKLQEAGIANGVAELTQSQARELLKLRPDTLRGRLAEARVQRQRELDGRAAQEARLSNDVSGYTDLIPGLNVYFKPDGTPTETGTRWAKARQFQRPISRELNSIIDEALDARDLSGEETAAELDRLVAAAEATDEIKNGVLPNFRKDSAKDDPAVFPIGEDGKPHPTPERHDIHRQIYALLMSDTISAANNEALATNEDGTAKEVAIIERANEGRPDLPPIPLQNPTYETQKEFRVDIVIGPPAAGKSSVFVNALSVFYRSRVLDCDTIKQMLPGFNNGNGASYVHEESSVLNKEMIRDVQQRSKDDPRRGENIVLPIVGEDTEGLRKKIAAWHAVGYTVYLHNNRVPIVHAFGRALVRTLSSGRWINPDVIKRCQDNPTRAYDILKKEVDYYDQFNNDVSYGEKPLWEDGNYFEPAYAGSRSRAGEDRLGRSADSRGVDGRLGRDLKRPASKKGQYILPGFERFSVEQPRFKYPNPLNALSDDELIAAAVAARMALGKSDKISDRAVKINTVQQLMRRLHPDWTDTDIGRESNRIVSDARKLGKKIREDLDRGVSESLILEHLPDAAREQFGREMREEARKGQRLGVFAQRVKGEIEERQARMIDDAVRVQTGLDVANIENAYGINLSETIMHLAENPLAEKPPKTMNGSAGEESATAADGSEGESAEGAAEIDAKVKAAVNDILAASRTAAEADERNRKDRRAAAGRAEERKAEAGEEGGEESDAGDALGEGDFLVNAVKKEGVDLENPRHLARFVAELARRQWIKDHGLKQNAEVWRDLVAVQFLRKTAQSVYAKLCRDLTYSRGRETAMQHIARFDAAPTVAGLMSEMEFVGALINARRIRDTQQQKCEQLDLFLRERFGAQGRFKPDKEEGKRKVSAEAELRARYMRHAMWLTPDAAAEEARQLQETLNALSVDFKDAGRDVDQSREFVETIRKLNVLREFGALRYKPIGDIDAAAQWWEDFERGSSDDIVREMSDRDIRTKKAAHLLALAFADPKRKTVREGDTLSDKLSRFITGHMGFVALLQDCMRFAPDADVAAVQDILGYISREVQKSGDRTEAEKRRHNIAFASAVESIYGKSFAAVMKEMATTDERFTEFMGEVGGKRVMPTKGRAMQLLVSLLQEGRKVQVEDEDNPGQMKTVWEGGYHDNIVKHKREGQAQKIMRLLTPADMNMIKWLGQWYEQNRSELSDVCKSLFGIGVYAELPNYFPVKMLLEKQGLEKGEGVGWTIFPKALTPRVKNERDFDTSMDIFSMWASRMEEGAQWKHHAQLGLEMRGIFGRAELQAAVIANHGKNENELMQGFITDILAGHGAYDRSTAGVEYFSDQIRGWTALCALGGNIGVMFKQTTSIPAFGFEIGLVNTAKYTITAFTPEGMAAMLRIWNSEQRQTRWQVGSSEAIRNALMQRDASILKRMLQASMITTKIGDVVPALVVGQGIYRDSLERGMSDEDAMAETWSIIERTQQSGRMENQTSIQRRNKLGRLLFQFMSTQQQYLQYEARTIREVIAKPLSVKRWQKMGSAIFLAHFILPTMYFWMGELYKACLGQEPPEDQLKDWLITCLLGPYGSLVVAGFLCKYTLERAIKGYSWKSPSMLPMVSFMKNQVNDASKLMEAIFDAEGNTWDEVLDAVGQWISDSNSTVRDLRKLYRFRVKEEPQNHK